MKTSPSPPPPTRLRPGSRPGPALTEGRALVLAGIVLSALNLRTAVTSITPLLDEHGRVFGLGGTMAGVLGMLPSAAFSVLAVATPNTANRSEEQTAELQSLIRTSHT